MARNQREECGEKVGGDGTQPKRTKRTIKEVLFVGRFEKRKGRKNGRKKGKKCPRVCPISGRKGRVWSKKGASPTWGQAQPFGSRIKQSERKTFPSKGLSEKNSREKKRSYVEAPKGSIRKKKKNWPKSKKEEKKRDH